MSRTQQFGNAQWGFQIEKSTVTALTATTHDQFQMLDSGNDVCAVFLDISMKVDSSACNHAKVRHTGLNNHLLHWICSSLVIESSRYLYIVLPLNH